MKITKKFKDGLFRSSLFIIGCCTIGAFLGSIEIVQISVLMFYFTTFAFGFEHIIW